MRHPDRLLHSQKRRPDGTFEPIAIEQAMDEIADRLRNILDEGGPRSVAAYNGTFFLSSSTHGVVFESLMHAIGSPMSFTPNTIDKPGKGIARALMGNWMAGPTSFADPEVVLMIGVNPLVSFSGVPNGDPAWMNTTLKNGCNLIVVDPRVTETAKRATLHLQTRPGSDIALVAGLIRIILDEGRYDRDFVAENVDGLDALERAVEPFTVERVAALADVSAESVLTTARMFGDTRRGFVIAGTGPNFAGHGTLLEYLCLALDTICGHWLREGERIPVTPVLLPAREFKAQAKPPSPARIEPMMHGRGLQSTPAGAPTAALPEEILLQGKGRVRALISSAGSPINAWPDQQLAVRAMQHLDLFVQIDPWMSPSAKLAHYVIAPTMSLETPGTTHLLEYYSGHVAGYGMTETYAAYTDAIVAPPEGSDVIEEWEFFYGIAQRLGLQLELAETFGLVSLASAAASSARKPVDMTVKPTSEQLIELMCVDSNVPLDVVRAAELGVRYPDEPVYVQPKDPGWPHRFDLGNAEMMDELVELATLDRVDDEHDDYPLRLLPRRDKGMYNSSVNDGLTRRGSTHNPLYMNPADAAARGLADGDLVEIESPWGRILSVVAGDDGLRGGVVSMVHAFGDLEPARDRASYIARGSNTSLLLDGDDRGDAFSGQPRMGNIPVEVRAAALDEEGGRGWRP
jgi:anaerobic selenocysteine-containing dehydrogenase